MSATHLVTALAPAAWGTTYLVVTELMPADRPLFTAAVRVLPVGLLLTVVGTGRPTGVWWWRMAVLGTLNIGAFQALLFVAAYRLPGGVAATAGAIQPLVVATLAAWLLGERFTVRTGFAGVAGVLGVALLVLGPSAPLDRLGIAAALTGTLAMAGGVVLTKRWGRPVGLLTATGWQLLAGGMVLAPLALVVEGPPPALTVSNWIGTAWLAIVGTGLAYVLWFRGIERLPVSSTSFLGLLSPLVATVAGWAVLGESLSTLQLLGAALVATAVVAPQVRSRRWPEGARPAGAAGASPALAGAARGRVLVPLRPRNTHGPSVVTRGPRHPRGGPDPSDVARSALRG